jgi:acetyl-CoA carboxylase biotin carboxylase subunit
MFRKILVANRGEIAVRIIRACREMGIQTVAVYSEADKNALHTELADESICIGPAASADSYLNMPNIISATVVTGADAIHPGFGFLSENSKFAHMCEECDIAFIGPSAEIIASLGDKSEAKKTMKAAGVPVIPGSKEAITDAKKALEIAREIGFPVMIKASAGGGGKGMRIAHSAEEFSENFTLAQQEAVNCFADGHMYLEKYIQAPRHVEFQILADKYGNVIHLGERDCSVQRRHQKLIEESPCTAIDEQLRKQMGETAVLAAKAAHYENAGTIEFLLDANGDFYFMEMNTRIQVEHGITEMVTGIDLIKEQIRIAAGEQLRMTQESVQLRGHAIECRINAEDANRNFMPCPGTVTDMYIPGGNGVRIDTALYAGYTIPPYYDSMLLKVMVYDTNREDAIRKMSRVLGEVVIEGVTTNLNYQYELIHHPDFIAGNISTDFIERREDENAVS